MKFIGAGLVWVSIFMFGIKVAVRYEQRSKVFCELIIMTEEITNGICYLSLPIDEIFIEIAESGLCKSLLFIEKLKSLTLQGYDFPYAWKTSLESTVIPLKKSEKERIISFGLSLGRSDSESQMRLIKLYSVQFNTFAEEAYIQRQKYRTTAIFSGLLFGGAMFILLI